jgi:hypothetical protein
MFLHEFRDDLVLALDLVVQGGDDAEVIGSRDRVLALEGGGAVFKELFLPGVEPVACSSSAAFA